MYKNREPALYSDLDLTFTPHPLTGDITPKTNSEAIKRSLKNLVQLNTLDLPFSHYKMKGVRNYMFEPDTVITKSSIEAYLTWLLKAKERRIEVKSIDIESITGGLGFIIHINYYIKAIRLTDNIEIRIQRIR